MIQSEFNLTESIRQRDEGIKAVSMNNSHFLDVARDCARDHARQYGVVTIDDVREWCELEPLHPNSYGSIFKHRDFVFTGRYRKSALVSNHGREIRIWELRNA